MLALLTPRFRLTATALAAGLLTAALITPSHAAPGTGVYQVAGTASVDGRPSADKVPTDAPAVFAISFTNTGADVLNKATVTLPADFAISAADSAFEGTVAVDDFMTTTQGNTVTAQAVAGALPTGETLTLLITATSATPGIYTFATTASGATGDHTRVGSDPRFTTFDVVYTCAPNETCVFPRFGPDDNTSIAITDYNGNAQDFIGVTAPSSVRPGCQDVTNDATPVAYESTNPDSRLDIHMYVPFKVTEAGHKDGREYDVCWQQDKPFIGKGGPAQPTIANGRTEYFARLALCSANANTVPCLVSVSKWTDPFSFKHGYDYLINGTAGDPVSMPTSVGLK